VVLIRFGSSDSEIGSVDMVVLTLFLEIVHVAVPCRSVFDVVREILNGFRVILVLSLSRVLVQRVEDRVKSFLDCGCLCSQVVLLMLSSRVSGLLRMSLCGELVTRGFSF